MTDLLEFRTSQRRWSPAEVWRYRELLRNLVVWGLKVKYQRSMLGFVWTLLNPLLMVATLTAVFGYVIRIQVVHYWAFLLSGYFVWNSVQVSLFAGTFVLAEHAALRRSVAFPSELLVFGAVLSRLIEFAIEMVLLIAVLAVFHHHGFPRALLVTPLLFIPLLLLTTGLMLPIATVSAFYRDTQHILPILLTALFYLTPVFYRVEMVPAAMRPWYVINPFAPLLGAFHTVLFDGRVPPLGTLAWTLAVSLVVFAAGYYLFNRYKNVAAEIV
jgi:lipopolysaccharide transport system permease protein